jgi:hypothetical protein
MLRGPGRDCWSQAGGGLEGGKTPGPSDNVRSNSASNGASKAVPVTSATIRRPATRARGDGPHQTVGAPPPETVGCPGRRSSATWVRKLANSTARLPNRKRPRVWGSRVQQLPGMPATRARHREDALYDQRCGKHVPQAHAEAGRLRSCALSRASGRPQGGMSGKQPQSDSPAPLASGAPAAPSPPARAASTVGPASCRNMACISSGE